VAEEWLLVGEWTSDELDERSNDLFPCPDLSVLLHLNTDSFVYRSSGLTPSVITQFLLPFQPRAETVD
jgi:hypothetical protein